ncbi:MAG: permease [Gemmatimonadetes bacterium]|nr:permease [Gemmatimonadota bacterium]
MSIIPEVRHLLRALFARPALERELDDELRFHLEQEAAKHVAAGASPMEAERRARASFGGVQRIKDDTRDARGIALIEQLSQDVRYAARGIRARPGFAAAVILTLGLGIGANATMFNVVDRLMFRPGPFLRDAGSVNRVYLSHLEEGKPRTDRNTEYTRFLDLARDTRSFSALVPIGHPTLAVGTGESAREMNVDAVGDHFFELFDAAPAVGRFFLPDEHTRPRGAPVAVLSWDLWQSRFEGRRDVLGTSLQVGLVNATVVGVAPRGFTGLGDVDQRPALYLPITTYAGSRVTKDPSAYYTNYNWGWLELIARRKPGVTVDAANADLSSAYRRSWEAERALSGGIPPADSARPMALAGPLQVARGPQAGRDASVVLWISGVSLIVLLIACANVANLFFARGLGQRREVAVRLALGVSKGRLLRQLLTDSVLLSLLGGVAGLFMAHWGGRIIQSIFLRGEVTLGVLGDTRTLVFGGAAAIACGVLTGLLPAVRAGRTELVTQLKSGARAGRERSRARTALLVAQGALSVVLLVGAGLFVRSLYNVRTTRLGYDVDPVLYVSGNLRGVRQSPAELIVLAHRLAEEALSVPGVVSAARGLTVPFRDTWSQPLFLPGRGSMRKLGSFTLQGASPEFFRTMGTTILRGRGFTDADRAGAPLVAVVTEKMASALWPGVNAIGQCMRLDVDTMPCTTVVGIAEDMHQRSMVDDPGLHYYLPIDQFHPEDGALFVRTNGDASAMAGTVRKRLQALMPGASYVNVTPMREIVGETQRAWDFGARMFLAFGLLALVLAAIGMYSVIAYDVAQRTQEMGVRMALGAQPSDLMRLVLGDGMRLTATGLVMGGALALLATRGMTPMLFNVSPRDPAVFGVVAAVLCVVSVVACLIPAVRSARANPSEALRGDS